MHRPQWTEKEKARDNSSVKSKKEVILEAQRNKNKVHFGTLMVGNDSTDVQRHSTIRSGMISGGNSLKRNRQSVFFTSVNPMDGDQGIEETRCNLDERKIVPYKNTWRPHQNTVYWFNLKLAHHTQSFSTTHCLRFVLRKQYAWRLEMKYTKKYIFLQGCLELYWNRIRQVDSRINLIKKQEDPLTTKAHPAVAGNPKQQHWLRNTRHTSICCPATGHESQRNSPKVDSAVRVPPEQGVFPEGLEKDRGAERVQRRVEEVDHRHEQYGDLRALRNLFQETMPRLCLKLGDWHCLLFLWKKSKIVAKN